MGKLFAVIRREYLERVRSKWFVIATLFGPVFFGAIMFVPALISSREEASANGTNITIVDATGTGLGERVSSRLSGGVNGGTTAPTVNVVATDAIAPAESLATQQVISGSVKGYLVLDTLTASAAKARYAGSNTTALFDMQRIERAVQREVQMMALEKSGVDAEVATSVLSRSVNVTTERLTKTGRGGSGQINFIFGIAVAFVLYLTIFIYGLNVLRGVLEEKQSRVAEVVIASISSSRLLAGKVIGVGGVGLTQLVLWLTMSVVMYKVRQPILAKFGADTMAFSMPDISLGVGLVVLAFFVLGFMFYAGLFAAAGATVNSEQEAQQAQMPVVLLLVTSITFLQNILTQPESTLSRVLSLLPFSAPIVMPLRMTVAPVPALEVALALLSVSLGAVGSVWLASRIYRVGLLMYGKRPSIREVVKWIGQK